MHTHNMSESNKIKGANKGDVAKKWRIHLSGAFSFINKPIYCVCTFIDETNIFQYLEC